MGAFPVHEYLVSPQQTIRDVMACIDRQSQGIALMTDADGKLLATITDGDIRRAILAGIALDQPVECLVARRPPRNRPSPIKAPSGSPRNHLFHLMNKYTLRHIPLVDEQDRVVDVALLSELAKDFELPLTAVIMVGGYGTRLRPLTNDVPKPMLPVDGTPLLERIVHQLKQAGIRRTYMATYYKRDIIEQHFGDGSNFGIEIRYLREESPMGTAGALSLLSNIGEPLLVINGDILTEVSFQSMLDFHRDHRAALTVALRQYELRVPYGVVELNDVAITKVSEKPAIRHFVNAGIYLLEPEAQALIPKDKPSTMPELIELLAARNQSVIGFPVREYWLDIGHLEDYKQAEQDIRNGDYGQE